MSHGPRTPEQTVLLLTRASLALDRTLTTGASCRSRTSSATPSSPTGRPIGSAPCPMACLDGIRWDPHIHPPAPTTPPSARCPLLCKYTVYALPACRQSARVVYAYRSVVR
eukprot:scaffold55582_cov58-Phaeocystis_antarctica.AAC.3